MFLFGKKKEESPKKGPSLLGAGGAPAPIVYRERSADNFQQEELNRLQGGGRQYRERVVGQEVYAPSPEHAHGRASPQPSAGSKASNDNGDRDRQFDSLKKQLEIALREGDTDRIIEGYRNLGQHFMHGKTLAEQQAAKQMFEKALEHAGLMNNSGEQAASPATTSPPAPAKYQGSPPANLGNDIDIDAFMGTGDAATLASIPIPGRTRKTVELERGPLPGMPLPADGLAGVGFSFETTSAGMHIISSLAPTGSAANSGRIQTGDVLRLVNSTDVQGLSAAEVIRLVKGPIGTKVVLGLDVLSSDTGHAASPPEQKAAAVSPVRSVTPVHQEPPPMPSLSQQTPQQTPQEALSSPQLPFPDPFQAMQGQPQLVQPQPMHLAAPGASAAAEQPMQPPPPLPQNKDPEPQPRLQQQSWPPEQRQAMPKAEAIENRAQALPPQPYQAPPQPSQAPPNPYQQSPAHANGNAESSHVPPEPGMPAPQNPVVGGNSTPARSASPAAQHIFNQPPSVTTTPGGPQQATPALRKRGKRLVFSREPAKGQVVLPEHPVGVGLNLSCNERGGSPFLVESLLPNSPAANCGQVAPGDMVYSIDGVRVKDKTLPEVIQMLKGPWGTQVTVVFQLRDDKMGSSIGPGQAGRTPSLQAFEAKLDLIAAEGLPTSNITDTGLCDPYLCVSLLPETVEPAPDSTLVSNHRRHAQANTKTCRKTVNPVWKETHVIRDMHNDSVIKDSNRPLPSAHERIPLSGQGFTVLFTVHSENGGAEDFVGYGLLRNCRPGPTGEYKLPLLDAHGRAVGFSGQTAMLHVRLTYSPAQGDIHQAEAAHKAAEMAASRKRRQESGTPSNGVNGTDVSWRSSSGTQPQPQPQPQPQQAKPYSPRDSWQASGTPANGPMWGSDSDKAPGFSSPGGLAALWVQAYASNTPAAPQRTRSNEEVRTDVLAFVPPPPLMATPKGAQYGDKRLAGPDNATGTHINLTNSMFDQIRMEMEAKDKALATLRTEHARLRERHHQLSLLNESSVSSSASTLTKLKEEVHAKTEQIRELQALLDQSRPAQERLEHQLNSAQQLVRGSLLQHERYEATTEQQVKEISQLKRDKERLEHEVQALRAEQIDFATGDGTKSLNELIDEERRRFKQALAQERARSAQALEKQQQVLERELQLAKQHASKEASRALMENALNVGADNTQSNQTLQYEVQYLRDTLSKERETSEKTFRELRDELAVLQRQATKAVNEDSSKSQPSSIVKTWYSSDASAKDSELRDIENKVSRLQAALEKANEERDHWRRREAEARRQLDEREDALNDTQVVREKEQAVQELREYEEEVEKLQAQRDNLHEHCSQLKGEKDTLLRTLEDLQRELTQRSTVGNNGVANNRSSGDNASAAAQEVEDLQSKLREKDKALIKLQKEHKRLQVMAAGRSPAALRTPGAW